MIGLSWKEVHRLILSFCSAWSLKFSKILELSSVFFFSLHTSPCLKKNFITKPSLHFSPDLHYGELSIFWVFFFLVHFTTHWFIVICTPQFCYQTRRSDYYFLLCSGLSYRTSQSGFLLLAYTPFSLNISYLFLYSWSLIYCCQMNDLNNTFICIYKCKICHLILCKEFNHIKPQFTCYT